MDTHTLTFNPGPSQLSPTTVQYIHSLADSGFLSESHRSDAFSVMSEKALRGLRKSLGIPEEYRIFYQPSATAAMEATLRNTVSSSSFHFVHGAFSKRFFTTARQIGLKALSYETEWHKAIDWENADIPADIELIAITHTETSTGLMWPEEEIVKMREAYPSALLTYDITSSCGAMPLRWDLGDVWLWSVQKCFGLPSGLGFLVVSPRAYDKALDVLKDKGGVAGWQRFDILEQKMAHHQTFDTPNMFNIALVAHLMSAWDLDAIYRDTLHKASLLYEAPVSWKPYIEDPRWRALTVANLCVTAPSLWHEHTANEGMTLGKGYGPLKESCVRVANFPAHSGEDISRLINSVSVL
jgi:phosphoserine aminotransferase